jgi:hypothetical protein
MSGLEENNEDICEAYVSSEDAEDFLKDALGSEDYERLQYTLKDSTWETPIKNYYDFK